MKCGYDNKTLIFRPTILLVFIFLCVLTTNAQDISVTEFYLDEKDLTANGRHAVEDQNGDKCALIRVQTTQKGFSFDVGSAGITKVEDNHVGEIWLWVPYGIRHISIRHQQLGSLPNYDFPITIQKARTYIMKITHDQVFVTNYNDTKKQKLYVKITPANASLFLNGMSVSLNPDGETTLEMAHGQFTYKVEAEGYYPKEGQVVVNDNQHSLIVNDLKPKMGKLSVHVNPYSANISVDGQSVKGSSLEPFAVPVGQHKVVVSASTYQTETRTVTVKENLTTDINVTLTQAAYFHFTSKPSGINVFVNGRNIGYTPCSELLTTGTYKIEAGSSGYKKYSKTLKLNCSEPEVYISLRKQHNKKNEFYIEGNARTGTFDALGGTIGGYISNVNLEASYFYCMKGSQKVYWCGNDMQPIPCTYKPEMTVSGKLGYGIPISTWLRITPQIGANYHLLNEKIETGCDITPANGAYAISGVGAIRISAAILSCLGISVSPEYSMSAIKSKGYEALAEVSPQIRKWSEGFNVKLGITVFF